MCGIVGTIDWSGEHPPDVGLLEHMLQILRHRGPDEAGLYVDEQAGMGCARLSILDLDTGQQPIANEDETLWIVLNGEIYNYLELRAPLERAGHRFSTRTDTEVILHLYEDVGADCLHELNGQFAIAIWDVRRRSLFLARDRLGIRPLFYAQLPRGLVFASELKALLLDPRLQPRLDPYALTQTFTFWAPLSPRTVFEGVQELPPGHCMTVEADACTCTRYWNLAFPEAGQEGQRSQDEAAEQLQDLLQDATRIRLRADVPVGSYLSGGLDSSLITALIRRHSSENLRTFSVNFEDPAFDERSFQVVAAVTLGTDHRWTQCGNDDIGWIFPQVVWHAEAPLMRTSPAPMYLLSRLVHRNDIKVVLTGEGADELLGGYNIYKEDKVRRFWARQPESTCRPLLLRRLYPYVGSLSRSGDAYLRAFFRRGLTDTGQPGYSHHIRWSNTGRLQRFFSQPLRDGLEGYDPVEEFTASLDGVLKRWSPLAQAQYIEIATFMSPYLLSSQGDRMMAANSVEGRFPFLDHRVVAFCNGLPPYLKIRGLQEKYILKRAARGLLPPQVYQRRKQPYRAPICPAFFARPLDYVETLLSPDAVRSVGLLDPDAVSHLVRKCREGTRVGESEDMALVGVLSTQLLHHLFVSNFPPRLVLGADPVVVRRRKEQGR